MDSQLSASPTIHFYDTDRHVILCGLRGFAHRSTKHARTVTCPSCVELLADRRAGAQGATESDAMHGGMA